MKRALAILILTACGAAEQPADEPVSMGIPSPSVLPTATPNPFFQPTAPTPLDPLPYYPSEQEQQDWKDARMASCLSYDRVVFCRTNRIIEPSCSRAAESWCWPIVDRDFFAWVSQFNPYQ